jgi:hypothetical protein
VGALLVAGRIAQLHPDTDPRSIAPTLARERPDLLQLSEPLPGRVLDAAAAALTSFPEVGFRVYGRTVDPSLDWLERFAQVRDLTIDLWHATSFDLLESFKNLRRLSLGETASKRPSLGFLRELPELAVLRVEAHDRDFAAVADVWTLRELYLRVSRARTLDPLRGHPRLEVIEIDFGGIRDLAPLAEIPALRGLQLYQIRKLDTHDLAAIGECKSLVAVSLGALRNVEHLAPFQDGPRTTLRFLALERMTGLETLAHLGECDALEQLYLVQSKPKDGRLDLVSRAQSLRHLVVGDHYPKQQVEAADAAFGGETLWVRGTSLRGDPERSDVAVAWRRPVSGYLALAAETTRAQKRPS